MQGDRNVEILHHILEYRLQILNENNPDKSCLIQAAFIT